jgi:hypothetical protein
VRVVCACVFVWGGCYEENLRSSPEVRVPAEGLARWSNKATPIVTLLMGGTTTAEKKLKSLLATLMPFSPGYEGRFITLFYPRTFSQTSACPRPAKRQQRPVQFSFFAGVGKDGVAHVHVVRDVLAEHRGGSHPGGRPLSVWQR